MGLVGDANDQSSWQNEDPRLIIPASNVVEFIVRNQEPPWPGREEHLAKWGLQLTNMAEEEWREDLEPTPSNRVYFETDRK